MRMKIIIVFFLFAWTHAFTKGRNGEYYLVGKAYDEYGHVIKNRIIFIQFGRKQTTVETDDNGNYRIVVKWGTSCELNSPTIKQRKEWITESNPKWINLSFSGKTLKVKNKWRRFLSTTTKNEMRLTRKQDLKFI
jgi:hypothetical protein